MARSLAAAILMVAALYGPVWSWAADPLENSRTETPPHSNPVESETNGRPRLDEAVGSVQGVVRVAVAPPNSPPMLSPYARRRYAPPTRDSNSAKPETVVFIRIDGQGGRMAAPESAAHTARVVQQGRAIRPGFTVIQVGTRVDFPNDDDVFHNLFSLSDAAAFNLGRYPPGESRSLVFGQPGIVRMFCDIHSDMEGAILVLDTPLFVRPDADGRFLLTDVPVGTHTVVAWHRSTGADSARVEVTPGGISTVDLRPKG